MRNRKKGYGCPEGCPVEGTLDVIGVNGKALFCFIY